MKKPNHFFVHCPNIHSGGGRALLSAMLAVWEDGWKGVFQVDQRMPCEGSERTGLCIRSIPPTVWQRFMAEWWLRKRVFPGDLVLCFGNLPPLLRLRGHVVVFLQNRYLVESVSLRAFSWKTRIRLELERRWLAWRVTNAEVVVVQTPSMQRLLLASGILRSQEVLVFPFVSSSDGYRRGGGGASVRPLDTRFLYVASGEPHKNHRRLVDAWSRLASEGVFPVLLLTLDLQANKDLCDWIEQQKLQYQLRIENLGVQSHKAVLQHYAHVDAVIFPSLFESLGIPLIEARQAQLPILAAELDYVRDVVDPEQVFDPMSPVSIARAVKRFLGAEERALPLLDARQFLLNILSTFK